MNILNNNIHVVRQGILEILGASKLHPAIIELILKDIYNEAIFVNSNYADPPEKQEVSNDPNPTSNP